jgi:diguanylate cyclase (GGDEF)-like protein
MWRIPDEILASRDDRRAIQFVLDQLAEPDAFVARVEELYGTPEAESYDELQFKDGRVFERYSRPQLSGEDAVGRVWSFRDVTERTRHEERLRHLADHDPLTGMYNRRRFEEEVERVCAYAGRYPGDAPAVILLDLDNFKKINDTLGHRAGDDVLKGIATVIRGRIRATDVAARIGGDEFAVVLPQAGDEGAQRVAADLLEAIRAFHIRVGDRRVTVTGSVGVALAGDEATAEQLLVDADAAMYQAKDAGRDRSTVHTPESALRALTRARSAPPGSPWPRFSRSSDPSDP